MSQTVNVVIKGTKPLLMNKFGGNDEETSVRGKTVRLSREEEAQNRLYKDEKGQVFVPFTWLAGSLRTVAGAFKSQLNKKLKSLKGLVGGAVIFNADRFYFAKKVLDRDVDIYSTSAVIPATRGRIMVHRPRINDWQLEFKIDVDTTLLTLDEVEAMLKDAGQRAGIGDYRISKGGPFGTFEVVSFKKV